MSDDDNIVWDKISKNKSKKVEKLPPLIHGQSFPMIHHNLDTMYGTEKL